MAGAGAGVRLEKRDDLYTHVRHLGVFMITKYTRYTIIKAHLSCLLPSSLLILQTKISPPATIVANHVIWLDWMFLKQVDLTTALRPAYLPDEVLLFVQDNVGLYEGLVLPETIELAMEYKC